MATVATDLVIFGEKYGQVLANFGYLASAELPFIWHSWPWWPCFIPSFDSRVCNIWQCHHSNWSSVNLCIEHSGTHSQ